MLRVTHNGSLRLVMRTGLASLGCAAFLVANTTTYAQQGAPAQPVPQPRPQAKAATPKPAGEPAAPATASGSDSALRQRIEQLEEQLVDMQVTIGTLDSLKGGAASSSSVFRGGSTPSGGNPGDSVRLDALEQQMRQLSGQLDQLTQQVRQLNARQSSAPATGPGVLADADATRPPVRAQSAVVGTQPVVAGAPLPQSASADQIGKIIGPSGPGGVAGGDDASPKQLYETAYGYLLAQDYGAAEVAFDEFLKRFPNDQLSGNAQYWLGETHFVRGQFKAAAGAFLKGYTTYARSSKAPDSLLKLALSLDRLGQKDAACSSFSELAVKFPNATAPVRNRADAERRRLACT
jgi:tol-pal system protein YbgF